MDQVSRSLIYGMSLKQPSFIVWSLLLALAGCAAAPPGTMPGQAGGAAPVPPGPGTAAPTATTAPVEPPTAETTATPAQVGAGEATPASPAGAPANTPVTAPTTAAKPAPPASASVAKAKPAAPRAPKPAAPPLAPGPAKPTLEQRPAAPTLDLAALEQRLRDTRAIGLFTKLSIKNQVDDLLEAFRAHFNGPDKPPLTMLRERYDLLLMKVLTLLQDGDPPLASAISSSREVIWNLLNDPAKLTAI